MQLFYTTIGMNLVYHFSLWLSTKKSGFPLLSSMPMTFCFPKKEEHFYFITSLFFCQTKNRFLPVRQNQKKYTCSEDCYIFNCSTFSVLCQQKNGESLRPSAFVIVASLHNFVSLCNKQKTIFSEKKSKIGVISMIILYFHLWVLWLALLVYCLCFFLSNKYALISGWQTKRAYL